MIKTKIASALVVVFGLAVAVSVGLSATSVHAAGAVCGSSVDACSQGTATNTGIQYVPGGTDYYFWDCASGSTDYGSCTFTPSASNPVEFSNQTGASCTSNSQCAAGFDCLSGQCGEVVCGVNNECGSGSTCINPDSATAQCVAAQTTATGQSSNPNGQVSCNLNGLNSLCNPGSICLAAGTALATCSAPVPAALSCPAGLSPYENSGQWECITEYQPGQALPTGCDSATDLQSQFCQPSYHYQFQLPGVPIPVGVGWVMGTDGKWHWTGTPSDPSSTAPSITPNLADPFHNNSLYATTTTGSGTSGSTGTTGSGTGLSVGSGNALTGSGSSVTSVGGSGSAGISTLSSNLSAPLAGFSAILSNIGGQAGASTQSGASTQTGTTTSGSTATSASGSTSSCTSSASATISSSLQTLQGLASVLSSSNVSPGVLTSIQNLINAVALVLTALSQCIH